MPPMIVVKNLSKRYLLSHQVQQQGVFRYQSLRETIERRLKNLMRGPAAIGSSDVEEFWAIQDLNLKIKQGDVVGVIGRNGAGKSTLLKLLSRITEPTSGSIKLYGRVASLLEVGTGFHPELTGRENIFLNAAILGMERHEVKRKFDEIVDFAEVERFLDTPVKRYSSGMYVRLAFSIAAHLEPQILIVDEVLAVGDAAFQKKCLGKMEDVATGEGRTVLFVSHNMSSVRTLCNRGILMEKGRKIFDGDIIEAISQYTNTLNRNRFEGNASKDIAGITHVEVNQEKLLHGSLEVRVGYQSPEPITPQVGIVLSTTQGQPLFGTNAETHPDGLKSFPTKHGESVLQIDELPLHTGSYTLSIWLTDQVHGTIESRRDAVSFDYVCPRTFGNLPPLEVIGPFQVDARWRQEER